MDYSLEDLGLAYRKAKVDLYYSTIPSLFALADYEENLLENLARLQQQLNGKSEQWAKKPEFLGGWTLFPKSINVKSTEQSVIFASAGDQWEQAKNQAELPEAEFRLMAKCSIDFHVVSALWMIQIGSKFEKSLSDNVYGSRLRRDRNGSFSLGALGSFQSYLKPFRDWRDGGIKAMRTALDDDKKIVAVTADVSSFYHELRPSFLLDENFLSTFDVDLSAENKKLHRLFISALTAWAENTPLGKGLPVGLPASAVVANLALLELDKLIEVNVAPIYYGRYVDDIILVLENTSKVDSAVKLWELIFDKAGSKEVLRWDSDKKEAVVFQPKYHAESRIVFSNSKNKVFVLAGAPGLSLVNSIDKQISKSSSEWRSLPSLPESPSHIAAEIVKATNHAGEQADNLRKTDALTLHRAGFALTLRDFEAYELDLPPQAWQKHRHALFDAINAHILTPEVFFELHLYFPRIVRMATACEDFSHLGRLITTLRDLVEKVNEDCLFSIKALEISPAPEEIGKKWQQQVYLSVVESVVSAFPPDLSESSTALWEKEVAKEWEKVTDILVGELK